MKCVRNVELIVCACMCAKTCVVGVASGSVPKSYNSCSATYPSILWRLKGICSYSRTNTVPTGHHPAETTLPKYHDKYTHVMCSAVSLTSRGTTVPLPQVSETLGYSKLPALVGTSYPRVSDCSTKWFTLAVRDEVSCWLCLRFMLHTNSQALQCTNHAPGMVSAEEEADIEPVR